MIIDNVYLLSMSIILLSATKTIEGGFLIIIIFSKTHSVNFNLFLDNHVSVFSTIYGKISDHIKIINCL